MQLSLAGESAVGEPAPVRQHSLKGQNWPKKMARKVKISTVTIKELLFSRRPRALAVD